LILLDTTVLVYAVGEDHVLRSACRRLFIAHLKGEVRATTTVEVIQEFAHVRARRRSREDAAALAREYAQLLPPLLMPDERDLSLGLELYEAHRRVGSFDAVLAAVALNRQIDFASADRAFADVPGLRWLDPADAVTRPS
jgi:predicted nucleic acid-binding protein